MAKSKKAAPVKSDKCHFCETTCGDDEYCHGCKAFICEKHSVNWNLPFGGHEPEVHLEGETDDDE